jgi:hypothetical protein
VVADAAATDVKVVGTTTEVKSGATKAIKSEVTNF